MSENERDQRMLELTRRYFLGKCTGVSVGALVLIAVEIEKWLARRRNRIS